jgi:hypothetical protein
MKPHETPSCSQIKSEYSNSEPIKMKPHETPSGLRFNSECSNIEINSPRNSTRKFGGRHVFERKMSAERWRQGGVLRKN